MNIFAHQNSLHVQLSSLVTGQVSSKNDLIRATLCPWQRRRRVNEQIYVDSYCKLAEFATVAGGENIEVEVPLYKGLNKNAISLQKCVDAELTNDLAGAFVHGSLGSQEDVGYSDFDALVILKECVLQSADRLACVAGKLQKAQKYMFRQDPLQHHGWFVLTPFDLSCYCEAYFPIVLFQHARSLMAGWPQRISIKKRDSRIELQKAFEAMSLSLLKHLERGIQPKNMYMLKYVLSGFMLLPSFYIQARTGCGVWKADSFALARSDFAEGTWSVMDEVSEIRRNWHVPMTMFRRYLLTRTSIPGWAFRKYLAPPLPVHLKEKIKGGLFSRMALLVGEFRKNFARSGDLSRS